MNCVEIADSIRQLPNKSCNADPLPIPILKEVAGEVGPFLAELFNRSVSTGQFPEVFKSAFITPLAKKPGLYTANVRLYRLISNLSVVSKQIEQIVAKQLNSYLQITNLSLLASLHTGRTIRPKLLWSGCCLTF